MRIILFAFFITQSFAMFGQDTPIGVWKTIDDETGDEKSYLEIYEQSGKLYGKIVKILSGESDALCDQCKGKMKDKPILNMVIMDGLENKSNYWGGGTILDPESGSTYRCKIWLPKDDNDILKVRGIHWTGLYRTQTWYRVKNS